jgi:hypothetical protein
MKERMSQANITRFLNQLEHGDIFKVFLPYGISIKLLFLRREEYMGRLRQVFSLSPTEPDNWSFQLYRGAQCSRKLDDWFVRSTLFSNSLRKDKDLAVISLERKEIRNERKNNNKR